MKKFLSLVFLFGLPSISMAGWPHREVIITGPIYVAPPVYYVPEVPRYVPVAPPVYYYPPPPVTYSAPVVVRTEYFAPAPVVYRTYEPAPTYYYPAPSRYYSTRTYYYPAPRPVIVMPY